MGSDNVGHNVGYPLPAQELHRILPNFSTSEFESPVLNDNVAVDVTDEHQQVVNYQGQKHSISSDAQKCNETQPCFPTLRDTGKPLALRPLQTPIAGDCFLPFQGVDDNKLARFFHLAHVPRV